MTGDTLQLRRGIELPLTLEHRVLDAAISCIERWGVEKLTIDDIAAAAKVSRATIYRMFPGGKEVLFEAMRVRELEAFFEDLKIAVSDADGLHEVIVSTVVTATNRLREDEHLAIMMASEPGETLSELTAAGLPRIVGFANAFLVPMLEPYLARDQAKIVIDVLSRLTISYFLAPSDLVDLGKPESAAAFLAPVVDVLTASHTSNAPRGFLT